MGCAGIGELRAFLDGELSLSERERMEIHLGSCTHCRTELDAIRETADIARMAVESLAPLDTQTPAPNWSVVQDRANGRVSGPVTLMHEWGFPRMFGDLFRLAGGSRFRVATSAVASILVVALLFTLSPVQTAAGSLLSIFRVKKFVAVTVDPDSLAKLASPFGLGSFTITGDQKPRKATLAEAEEAVGFRIPTPELLPSGLEPAPRSIMVTGDVSATYVPDLTKMRAHLESVGAADVDLPQSLDGAAITLRMPPSVAVLYSEKDGGTVRSAEGLVKPVGGQRFIYIGATTSPTLQVPDGIDVEQVRAELLKMPGLPTELVNQLRAIDDWRNTVVIPVVKGTARDVMVQGEKGLMITEPGGEGITLLWLKGNVVYTVTGSVSESEILVAANSLR